MMPRRNPLRQPEIIARIRDLVAANPAGCGNDALVCIVLEEFELTVTPGQVSAALWKEGISRTDRVKGVRRPPLRKLLLPTVELTCLQCQRRFIGKRQLYCSPRCRELHHTKVRAERHRKAQDAKRLVRDAKPHAAPETLPAIATEPGKIIPDWRREATEQQRKRDAMLRQSLLRR